MLSIFFVVTITIQVIHARKECGEPGISRLDCFIKDCSWDATDIPRNDGSGRNEPWCFVTGSDVTDEEHSLPGSDRPGYKNNYEIKLTNASVQFSGDCLFHCTAIPPRSRLTCSSHDVTIGSCLRGGCCYDQSEPNPTKRCFHSSPLVRTCPPPQCQIPDGKLERCFARDVTPDACQVAGCCSVAIGSRQLCFQKQGAPKSIEMPAIDESFLNSLKQQQIDPEEVPLFDLLSKSKVELLKNRPETTTQETTTEAPTTTPAPTEAPTTPRTETPPPVTEAPYKRRVCKWFVCRWETVYPKPKMCYPTECGVPYYYPGSPLTLPTKPADSESSILKKIVGGSRAYPFSHPWTAMFLKREGEKVFVCGASIICNQWLVTAAHCMNRQTKNTNQPDLDTRFYEVHVGRYMGADYTPGKQVQKFIGHDGIDRIVLHENFTSGVTRGIITNDIALIRLTRPIEFNHFVQPVCLPAKPTRQDSILWATGWGDTRFQGPSNKNMKQIGVKVLNETACDEQVTGFKEERPQGVVCAGGELGQDTCTGDSGGPLVGPKLEVVTKNRVRRHRYRWQLFGLTSIGSPSCNTRKVDRQPAIYTNVHYFKDWISRHTQNCCA